MKHARGRTGRHIGWTFDRPLDVVEDSLSPTGAAKNLPTTLVRISQLIDFNM